MLVVELKTSMVHNKKVIRRKSAKNYNARPYISALLCKSLFAFNGTLDPDGLLIVTVNSIGVFTQFIYVIIYLFYAPNDKKSKSTTCYLRCLDKAVGTVLNLPRDIMLSRTVIKTKSVEYMPFFLSLFLLLNACCWGAFGEVIRRKSAKNYNALPYISALLCKSLWAFYGTLDPDGLLIVTVNSVTALIFVGIMNIGIPGAVILATLLGFHGSVRQTFIGIICAVVTIAIYAAPLSVMLSNAIGILSSSAQLVIYMIYRKNSSSLNIKPQEESKEYLKEQFEDSLPSIEEGKIQSQDFDQIKQQPSRFKS
ncbi:hypothetical protein LguiB_006252 [Lonicera macranthoides]